MQEESDRQRSDGRSLVEGVPVNQPYPRQIRESPEIVMLNAPRSIAAEKFRRLKTTLVHRSGDPVQVIVSQQAESAPAK